MWDDLVRSYSENIEQVKSTNKWFQLTFRFELVNGEVTHHLVERNDKGKSFKFIKFYL